MSQSLHVIALISGGKDSLYTLLHCIQNGHKVVALANLYPTSPEHTSSDAVENEDINSFMYQTVGHSVIPLYADALQLPLYRQQIKGTSKQTGRYYDSSLKESSSDETEDLLLLLKNVKHDHPEADALCSGAILSTYQRTRIESVATRLGLTSLAYLWQYPFLPPPSLRQDSLTGLLEDMSAAGCDSRIIKTASGGMPEELLGLNIADTRIMKRMVANMAPFFEGNESALRGALLGEGGEFETLALDGPRPVWKKKIEITEPDSFVVSEEGGVKWLRLGQPRVVQRETHAQEETSMNLVRVPCPFDPQFDHIATAFLTMEDHARDVDQRTIDISTDTALSDGVLEGVFVKLSLESDTLTIANMIASDIQGDAAQQMENIASYLETVLLQISRASNINPPLSSASIISTTLLLGSMSSFPSVNTQYARIFPTGLPNPPARVTIACPLPPRVLVSLSCTFSLLPRSTYRGLHVQTRSYWAPANIGPYSQAICVPFNSSNEDHREFVYTAGQIPLVPESMELLQAPFTTQALLALQHLWRVGQERGVDLWTWGTAFLPRLDSTADQKTPQLAAEVWKLAHLTTVNGESVLAEPESGDEEDDESSPDAWDLKYGRMRTNGITPTVGKHRHILPNSAVMLNERDRIWIPPIIVAEVEELPRSAPIEWHSHGLGGLANGQRSTSGVDVEFCEFPWGTVSVCSYRVSTQRSSYQDGDEEDDPTMSRKVRNSNHHFVTMQISRTATAGTNADIPPISEVLGRVLPARSSMKADGEEKTARAAEAGDRFSILHGLAYIAGVDGEAAFIALGGSESMSGLALVPCRRLWSKCYQAGAADHREDGIVDSTMAMTLRVDTFAESG